ncbi:hypothetical protein LEP1GSC127_3528 [Leptospira kirschneri str. 200801925]|uniref:Uncharacterized protein n=1 Tax=Leptospira kirschneri str. 200802841 TaxID=1193047 RepID=A0A828Y9T5_9LEPT|nr:hypothetical protein LEP1GSC044_2121 [Leptospira kirschneri serovar Grippotyphosa str. RM52]EKO52769.1 hypothetical protein LEP1GSC131_2512 [Leptospira kirschneri str. 200802841]EKP07302.1 hypothetical protein LEP1GSC018_2888 [Leptospira kirschneri str. 2008720114]EMK06678.1 hypothetical protein LEP1GSC176_0352 [Leptospira kirschneri str. MMD1493]EMO76119.1 hypothetical protein LEP1GSC127_3528 [Leptospira kirschneri str. 200801925]EPG51625.1 hypothetical protein LEP1GSC049_2488 [Leptospira 
MFFVDRERFVKAAVIDVSFFKGRKKSSLFRLSFRFYAGKELWNFKGHESNSNISEAIWKSY